MFTNLRFGSSRKARQHRRPNRRAAGRLFFIEALEERVVLSTSIITINPLIAVTHDESQGLQNGTELAPPGEDNDDNDTDQPLPAEYSHLLTLGTPLGVAKSNGNVISIEVEPGAEVDVGFTDVNGDPLNGDDSGLSTNDGNSIFLYTDTENNNIVLGREGTGATANLDGTVVFAVVLDEMSTNGTVTGAEIWIVQFQAIQHDDATDPDDAVDLGGKLFVAVKSELVFDDFSKVPSGQQQWIGLNDPRPAGQNQNTDILFTGKAPPTDTVNTSTTGLGSNNQSVDPREAIRVDFVTNLNVTTGDFKNLGTMSHDGYYAVDNSGFSISQTQSNSAVVARVRIYDETSPGATLAGATAASKATDLTDDGLSEAIDLVKVSTGSGDPLLFDIADGVTQTQNGITVRFGTDAGGAYVDVQGLRAGMSVTVSSADADGFNRLLVENVSRVYGINKGFDLGGVILGEAGTTEDIVMNFPLDVLDGDGDKASGSIQLTLDGTSPG